MKNGSNGSKEENGNTSAFSSRSSPLFNYFFTLNNYTEDDIIYLETYFSKNCKSFIFQEEEGKEGTKHLQGSISLIKKKRFSQMTKILPRIHWEATKNIEAANAYCCKDETSIGRKWQFPKPLKLINPTYNYQIEILDIISKEPDERKVYWYWESNGNVGKSSFTKYLVVKHNAMFIDEGKKADIMKACFDYDFNRYNVVVIDIPRDNGNKVSYKSIESIKNGCIFSSKYESGFKAFNSPHLIVFSNFPPEMDKLSMDRWVVNEIKI